MAVVSTGSVIQDTDFNNLRNRVSSLLGTGSGATGYGQSLTSQLVAAGTVIDADHFNGLFTDITRIYLHQFGSTPTALSQVAVGDIIAANTSGGNTTKGVNDIDAVLVSCETTPTRAAASQMSNEAKISSTRTTAWNGTVNHIVTVSFIDTNQRRYFFNSGGEIRFRASLTGGTSSTSGTKDNNWSTMLANMGTIKMNYTQTTVTGSGSGSAIGFYDLTTSNQKIFTRTGSGNYVENTYDIYAYIPNSTQIIFTINFVDSDTGDQSGIGAAVDENVTGTLTSYVDQYRATSTSSVIVSTPSYTNTNVL